MADATDTTKSHNQHDAFFKESFAILEYAAAFLRERLPRRITRRFKKNALPELIDSNFVGADGRQSRGDMLYRVWLESGGCVYVLIEHKSQPDGKTLRQLDRYLHGVWERYAETDADEGQTLPTVIPLVVYHGEQPWNVPESYADILGTNEIVDKRYSFNFRYRLINLGDIAHRNLSRVNRELWAVLAVLRGHGRRAEGMENLVDIVAALPDNNQKLTNLALRYLGQVWCVSQARINAVVIEAKPGDIGEKIMRTFVDELEDKGEARGIIKGIVVGKAEGKAETLKRQLGQKFDALPQAVEKQIEQASQEQIESWLDKILAAKSLEDMFPGHSMH
ncbi:MAG: Rpn family recombination-promoting nuclease/putative transposase [Pseudohongiellaceae bacterium]